jgi:hypothetical protein
VLGGKGFGGGKVSVKSFAESSDQDVASLQVFVRFRSRVPLGPPHTHINCTAAPACGRGSQAAPYSFVVKFDHKGLAT